MRKSPQYFAHCNRSRLLSELRSLIARQESNPYVRMRRRINVEEPPRPFSKELLWKFITLAICSSQQRSGPGSGIERLAEGEPFSLRAEQIRACADAPERLSEILRAYTPRFHNKNALRLIDNLRSMDSGMWVHFANCHEVLATVRRKNDPVEQKRVEREVAQYTAMVLDGVGAKQARNIWMVYGLFQYETPIDSRVASFFNALSAGFNIETARLAQTTYYNEALDSFQSLCEELQVLPCVVDAAIFASKDGEKWVEGKEIWF
jgi:hypothetical protein